ncbi:hypothetical protein BU24DRAFT_203057 [Aaosphaeria arxii CBS 175.79]|uniref:Uncharacterized protein n=1 Tax=Aaosphaeria arxii CBS 175.79 TaxID=1450172 RepID=A0A6A5XT45_9PLEO|nr:uncharacterized protein BU24DRAFT_203057 [Aaosphaeria arxii CBS 175.79]KAF2016505.1 hypothetical protein BU24DRAFT_203057 [Aaosphaeria arxii CBS 175.79]
MSTYLEIARLLVRAIYEDQWPRLPTQLQQYRPLVEQLFRGAGIAGAGATIYHYINRNRNNRARIELAVFHVLRPLDTRHGLRHQSIENARAILRAIDAEVMEMVRRQHLTVREGEQVTNAAQKRKFEDDSPESSAKKSKTWSPLSRSLLRSFQSSSSLSPEDQQKATSTPSDIPSGDSSVVSVSSSPLDNKKGKQPVAASVSSGSPPEASTSSAQQTGQIQGSPATRINKPATRTINPATRTINPATRTINPATRTINPATRTVKPETRINKPDTRTKKPDTKTNSPDSKPSSGESPSSTKDQSSSSNNSSPDSPRGRVRYPALPPYRSSWIRRQILSAFGYRHAREPTPEDPSGEAAEVLAQVVREFTKSDEEREARKFAKRAQDKAKRDAEDAAQKAEELTQPVDTIENDGSASSSSSSRTNSEASPAEEQTQDVDMVDAEDTNAVIDNSFPSIRSSNVSYISPRRVWLEEHEILELTHAANEGEASDEEEEDEEVPEMPNVPSTVLPHSSLVSAAAATFELDGDESETVILVGEQTEEEKKRIAEEEAEQLRILNEEIAKEERIAEEEKAAREKRIAAEEAARVKRIAEEKAAEEKRIAEQQQQQLQQQQQQQQQEQEQEDAGVPIKQEEDQEEPQGPRRPGPRPGSVTLGNSQATTSRPVRGATGGRNTATPAPRAPVVTTLATTRARRQGTQGKKYGPAKR